MDKHQQCPTLKTTASAIQTAKGLTNDLIWDIYNNME